MRHNTRGATAGPIGVVRRISWGRKGTRVTGALLASALLLLTGACGQPGQVRTTPSGPPVSIIVRTLPGSGSSPEQTAQSLGGHIGLRLGIIHGFAAQIPEGALPQLASTPGVLSISPDRVVHSDSVSGYDPTTDKNSMYTLSRLIGANTYWNRGYTGKGVDVAVIDTGVSPVDGLSAPGKVINGADLSFESQADNLRYLDSNGHGTFMAGIIAGRDNSVTSVTQANPDQFMGIAPDARIVNVKVGDAYGATDTSQVIAAIDWVVQHRYDNGMNIRVLNLSFGTDSTQSYTLDPLAYAAETAWRKGIVVVTSAGNDGYGSSALNDPAFDPYVIAVGAVDLNGTASHADDSVPSWSSSGDGTRNPDLVAPGVSLVSLRDPGSQIDQQYPSAVVGSRFFRGSGTSQATAMVSGAVALIEQERPGITPDQVKSLLTISAMKVPGGNPQAQGNGSLDLGHAAIVPTQNTVQTFQASTGLGTLEGSRGTAHLTANNVTLRGEEDIFGTPWNASAWSQAAANETSWSGGNWNGYPWTGSAWTSNSWTGSAWASIVWTRCSWSRSSWSRNSWSRNSWSRQSWSGGSWTRSSWTSNTFARQSWSTVRWG